MKKIYILVILTLCVFLKVYAAHDDRFLNSLKNCAPYTSNGAIDTQGVSADYNSSISGWDNDRCVYRKNVKFSGVDACIECRFTQSQIDKLIGVMNAYEHLQEYYEEDINFSDLEAIKKNPVVKVWSSYFSDPSTCTMNLGVLQP